MVHLCIYNMHFCHLYKNIPIKKTLQDLWRPFCSFEERAVSYNKISKYDFEPWGSINETNHTTHISLWKMAKQTNFNTNWNNNNKSKSVLLKSSLGYFSKKSTGHLPFKWISIISHLSGSKHNLQYLQFSNLVRPKGSEPIRALD